MRAVIDLERCEGNARCVGAAPEVFALGDDDQARVLITNVPPEFRIKLEQAVRVCPRQAIVIADDKE